MWAALQTLLALPGIGRVLEALWSGLKAGGIYWKGRQDARTAARLAQEQARSEHLARILRLEREHAAVAGRAAAEPVDVLRERLRDLARARASAASRA